MLEFHAPRMLNIYSRRKDPPPPGSPYFFKNSPARPPCREAGQLLQKISGFQYQKQCLRYPYYKGKSMAQAPGPKTKRASAITSKTKSNSHPPTNFCPRLNQITIIKSSTAKTAAAAWVKSPMTSKAPAMDSSKPARHNRALKSFG